MLVTSVPHQNVPSVPTAQVWKNPIDTLDQLPAMGPALTQDRVASVRTPQICPPSTATLPQLVAVPSWAGESCGTDVVGPISRLRFRPQHHRVPSVRTPQISSPPADALA